MRFALVLLLAACGSSAPKAQTAPPAPAAKGDPTCPMEVPGTSVTAEDTDKGAALVFVTTGDHVELWTRADTFEAAHQNPKMADGFAAMIQTPSSVISLHRSPMPENMARLEFEAKAPADMAKLQSELRMHASMLTPGSCKMNM